MTAQLNFRKTARLLVGGLLSLYLIPAANAQGNGQHQPWKPNPAFQTCEQSAGVTAGQKPTQAQWTEIRTCMKTAWQSAETQCAQATSVTWPPAGSGQHLDKADWRKMRSCMKTAGFRGWPNNHGGGHHEHGQWQKAETSPVSVQQ